MCSSSKKPYLNDKPKIGSLDEPLIPSRELLFQGLPQNYQCVRSDSPLSPPPSCLGIYTIHWGRYGCFLELHNSTMIKRQIRVNQWDPGSMVRCTQNAECQNGNLDFSSSVPRTAREEYGCNQF